MTSPFDSLQGKNNVFLVSRLDPVRKNVSL